MSISGNGGVCNCDPTRTMRELSGFVCVAVSGGVGRETEIVEKPLIWLEKRFTEVRCHSTRDTRHGSAGFCQNRRHR